MEATEVAPRLGAAASLAALLLVAVPYALVDAGSVGVYYGVGPVGPPLLSLFLAVTLVALLSGTAGRADPATVAGVSLVFGLVVAGFGLWWAVAATEVVGGLPVTATFDYHRWAFAGAGLVVVAAAAWYARQVV